MNEKQQQRAGERLWWHREQFRRDTSAIASLLSMYREWSAVRSGDGEWPAGVNDFMADHVLAAAESLARLLFERVIWLVGEFDDDASGAIAEHLICLTSADAQRLRELADARHGGDLDAAASALVARRLSDIAAGAAE